MPVTTKIDPIDQDIKIFISDLLSPEAQSEAFASFAEDALADAEATDASALGYTPTHTTFVDGSQTDDLTTVSPTGTIAFVFDIVGDSLLTIYQMLLQHAPVLTGEYRDSIKLYADGTEVDPSGDIPPASSQYTFLSGVAYARKIEGVNGKKPESSQTPDGVFEAVATLAQQQFGNTAKISFAYISPADGGIVDWAKTPGAHRIAQHLRGGNKALHQDWLTRVPAIVITPR